MYKGNVIIHIGYSKTGTSFLQKWFFPNLINVNNFKKSEILNQIIKVNPLNLNDLNPHYFVKENNKISLLSYELLTGSPKDGGLSLNLTKNNADKLKILFPNAKILIFIRNQIDIIISSYCQYVFGGGTWNLKNYLFHPTRIGPPSLILFDFAFFKYCDVIDYYSSLFGKENIEICLYEEMENNNYLFLRKLISKFNFKIEESTLQEISKIKEHTSYNQRLLGIARFLNLFTSRKVLNKRYIINIPGFLFFARKCLRLLNKLPLNQMEPNKFLGTEIINYICNYYKKSNNRLAKRYNLTNIKNFNYPL